MTRTNQSNRRTRSSRASHRRRLPIQRNVVNQRRSPRRRSAAASPETSRDPESPSHASDSLTFPPPEDAFATAFASVVPPTSSSRDPRVDQFLDSLDADDAARHQEMVQDDVNADFNRGITYEKPGHSDGILVTHVETPVMPHDVGIASTFQRKRASLKIAGILESTRSDTSSGQATTTGVSSSVAPRRLPDANPSDSDYDGESESDDLVDLTDSQPPSKPKPKRESPQKRHPGPFSVHPSDSDYEGDSESDGVVDVFTRVLEDDDLRAAEAADAEATLLIEAGQRERGNHLDSPGTTVRGRASITLFDATTIVVGVMSLIARCLCCGRGSQGSPAREAQQQQPGRGRRMMIRQTATLRMKRTMIGTSSRKGKFP